MMDIKNEVSSAELMVKLFNLLELSLTLQDFNGWTDLERPHIVVDIHLPSEKAKELIEQNMLFISTICSLTQGEIESIFFGELITRGLLHMLGNENLQTIDNNLNKLLTHT
jgi:hypothetical protein